MGMAPSGAIPVYSIDIRSDLHDSEPYLTFFCYICGAFL